MPLQYGWITPRCFLIIRNSQERRNSRFTPIPPPPGEPRTLNCSAVFFMFLSGKLLGKMRAFKVKAGGTTHSLLSYTSFISQGYLNMYLCALRNRRIGAWHVDLNPSNSSAVRGMLGLASRVAMRRRCNRREEFPLLSLHPKQVPETGSFAEATRLGACGALLENLGFVFQAMASVAGVNLPLLVSTCFIPCFLDSPNGCSHSVMSNCLRHHGL